VEMEKKKSITPQHLIDKCPECSSSNNLIHDYDTGETICGNCGLVLHEHMLDKGPEWKAFTEEEKNARCRVGIPSTLTIHDKGLSTQVGRGGPRGVDYDAFGRKLPLATRLQMWRLKKWQIRSRVHSAQDRNLAQACGELDRLSDKLYIPGPVKEKAVIIYRKALKKGLVRGRTINVMAAAALYVACRDSETPRALWEIAEVSLVEGAEKERIKGIARCYRLLLKELNLQMPIAVPLTYISKIAEKVGIPGETQGLAIKILRQAKILQQAKKKPIGSGKDPIGLAGAALYIASQQNNEGATQEDIAKVAGVTSVTIRNRYKHLKRELGLKLPEKKERRKIFQRAKNRSLFIFYYLGLTKFTEVL